MKKSYASSREKNVLITGANGQLGSGIKEISADHLENFHFIFTDIEELDLTNHGVVDEFVKENNINYIINCAAFTAVDRAEDEISLCYRINKDAVANLGKAANSNNIKMIHISTDYVYDGTKNTPYVETDPTNPLSVYGKSKEEGEIALFKECPQSIVIRASWLYSPFGSNFVKTMIKLGHEKDTINVVSDQTGTPTSVHDLAKAIMTIVEYSEKNEFKQGIYHYSNEGATTWYDFTLAIFKDAGITSCKVNPVTTDQYPTKAIRPKYSVLDKTKIKKVFGLSIPEWNDSLNICIRELLSK